MDICFFNGEEVPSRACLPEALPLDVPEGYKYDTINRDALPMPVMGNSRSSPACAIACSCWVARSA